MKVSAIIPALNEEDSISAVITSIDRRLVSEVIIGDNGSTDKTADAATKAGAKVVFEPRKGYGWACSAAIGAAPEADIYLFLDGDGSDDASRIDAILAPIRAGEADFVIGSRVLGACAAGALSPPQRFGNWVSTRLVNVLFATNYTDLGPFRAIKRGALEKMKMRAMSYGWTVEMQIKAAAMNLRIREIPVNCLKRFAGKSKVDGTVRGVVLAGTFIFFSIGASLVNKILGRYEGTNE